MSRQTSRLWAGVLLFISMGVIVAGRCMQRAIAQDGLRGRLAARFAGRLQEGPDGSGAIPARFQQRPHAGRDRAQESKAMENLTIAGLQVSVWRPAPDHAGPAPLVLFSHGFHGGSTQSTFLMKALADHGYLVIALNHKDSYLSGAGGGSWKPDVGFEKPGNWSDSTYKNRADDVTSLLRALKKDPTWSNAIDWSKIALAGHSLGGYTVLGLAGGWPSWKLPDIKAVLALSPYCNPYIQKGSLSKLGVPVMYQGGTWDIGITPFVKGNGGAFDQTTSPAYFVEFDKAGHFAWTDLNARYQPSIIYYSLAFLDRYVKGNRTADLTRRLSDVTDLRSK